MEDALPSHASQDKPEPSLSPDRTSLTPKSLVLLAVSSEAGDVPLPNGHIKHPTDAEKPLSQISPANGETEARQTHSPHRVFANPFQIGSLSSYRGI